MTRRRRKSKGNQRHARRRAEQAGGPERDQALSERVWAFAGDYIRLGDTPEDRQSLLNAACSVWNMALTPEHRREEAIREYLDRLCEYNPEMPTTELTEVREDIEKLLAERLRLFPEDERRIINAWLTPAEDGRDRVEILSARVE